MEFFDANCMVGSASVIPPGGLVGTQAIVEELHRCGVGKALVYHALARRWDPVRGNAQLAAELTAHPGLVGCWVGDPLTAGDARGAEAQVKSLLGARCKALRLFPDAGAHRFALSGSGVRRLLAACASRRIPVVIDTQQPDWSALDQISAEHHRLPIVLTNLGYRWGRDLYPVLLERPNVLIEISTFAAHGAVEDVVARFGAGRLVFGTNLPLYAAGAAVSRLLRADLSEDEKFAIASTNLTRLLSAPHDD